MLQDLGTYERPEPKDLRHTARHFTTCLQAIDQLLEFIPNHSLKESPRSSESH